MPSDIAKQIVQQVFGDNKAAAVDSINDAIAATTYDAIQARKVEFAKAMGFELDDTAQDSADEIEKSIDGVGDAEVTDVDTSGVRLPSDPDPNDPPADVVPDPLPPNTAVVDSIEPIEEPKDETDI